MSSPVLGMERIEVALGDRSYPIYLGDGALDQLPAIIDEAKLGPSIAVVSDANVAPLYADRVLERVRTTNRSATLCTLPAGEVYKRLDQIETLCGAFLEAGLDRGSSVIALGGGVVGDVAAFAAAVYMRGIRVLQIPTTIVAQVDSSVGGKTGVNHPKSKNSIGAFHQPSAVMIDPDVLGSLPQREYVAGLAEVIKHGVIADAELFAYMRDRAESVLAREAGVLVYPIRRSCEIKSAVVAADERESGVRAHLNYGHTFGHAIESVTRYERFLHGEAIAIGMMAAAKLGESLGMVDADFVAAQHACIERNGLPTHWPDLPIDETLDAMRRDKKMSAGRLTYILPERLGAAVRRSDVEPDAVRSALESVRSSA